MKMRYVASAFAAAGFLAACAGEQQTPVGPEGDLLAPRLSTSVPLFSSGGTYGEKSGPWVHPTVEAQLNPIEGLQAWCAGLGTGYKLFKIDLNNNGTIAATSGVTTGFIRYTIRGTGNQYLDWESDIDVAVIAARVKGGTQDNIYSYNDTRSWDNFLTAPAGAGISHYSFCYDDNPVNPNAVTVAKTAVTSLVNVYNWEISKTGDQDHLTLAPGQTFTVNYTVESFYSVSIRGRQVNGIISITNDNANGSVMIENVTDVLFPDEGIPESITADILQCKVGAVDVGIPSATAPYELAAGATLDCAYRANADGSDPVGTNRATATVSARGLTVARTGLQDYDFANATVRDLDNACIIITDDKLPSDDNERTVCFDSPPANFKWAYSLEIGPFGAESCGDQTFTNTASWAGDSDFGQDSYDVKITVPCEGGCTLTIGYWRTHSKYGPAPYDATWAKVDPNGEDSYFFASGQSWYQVFWTAPSGGNVYYQLAHQYMAAKLNILAGASTTPAVDAALTAAESFFAGRLPTASVSRQLQNQMRTFAELLDSYNNGLIGPGKCSE